MTRPASAGFDNGAGAGDPGEQAGRWNGTGFGGIGYGTGTSWDYSLTAGAVGGPDERYHASWGYGAGTSHGAAPSYGDNTGGLP